MLLSRKAKIKAVEKERKMVKVRLLNPLRKEEEATESKSTSCRKAAVATLRRIRQGARRRKESCLKGQRKNTGLSLSTSPIWMKR